MRNPGHVKNTEETETHGAIRKFICTFIAVISESSIGMFVYSWSSCVKTYNRLSGSPEIMEAAVLAQKLQATLRSFFALQCKGEINRTADTWLRKKGNERIQ